ncbi:MAG TPA: ATP-binding cassette domain-containing protein [Actinomycetota bacterium]|nr:ATP-binding cassette domain-containing protein [Actinomycetota bacterium]
MESLTETLPEPTAAPGPLYRLAGVERVFRVGSAEVRAVDGVDLDLYPGELVAIEGPSGSGKSTMLQLLGALDQPTGGTVSFDGRSLGALGEAELTTVRAKDIGFVFQGFNLIPTLTASENVELAMVPMAASKAERRARAGQLLSAVGLAERARHVPTLLSGGEQQRVAIARAMANRPRVILADEPTGNLDTRSAEEIGSILRTLAADQGVTVIVVTHSAAVAGWASRRLRMRDGKLTELSADEVAAEAALVDEETGDVTEEPAPAAPSAPAAGRAVSGITGVHLMLYSPEAEALRAQVQDAFGWSHVDAGNGWPIFALPPAELAVHPGDVARGELCLMCRDLPTTLAEIRQKGVEVVGEPHEERWGTAVSLRLPGGVEVLLYQPRHPSPLSGEGQVS